MKKVLLFISFLSSPFLMKAQWDGTNPLRTNPAVTNTKVGINNNTPTVDLNIGTPTTGTQVTTNTTKLSIQEDNPFIELKDVNGYYMGAAGNSGAQVGIRFQIPSGTTELGYSFFGAMGPVLSLKNSATNLGFHLMNNSIWIGGSGGSVANATTFFSQNSTFLQNTDYQGVNNIFRGKLQIGTRTHTVETDWRLSVEGKILCHSLKVTTPTLWADYVFKKGYKLKPLSEVKSFIESNQHLPEVPSESQILEKGYDINEMDATLLKKIEELTLYVIQLEEKVKSLENSSK